MLESLARNNIAYTILFGAIWLVYMVPFVIEAKLFTAVVAAGLAFLILAGIYRIAGTKAQSFISQYALLGAVPVIVGVISILLERYDIITYTVKSYFTTVPAYSAYYSQTTTTNAFSVDMLIFMGLIIASAVGLVAFVVKKRR